MVSVLVSSAIDRGFESRSRQTKDSIKEKEQRVIVRIRIMCPSGATCLSADCWFSMLAL
jgi:hypothetical protein